MTHCSKTGMTSRYEKILRKVSLEIKYELIFKPVKSKG